MTTALMILASCGRVDSSSGLHSAVAPTAISFSKDMRIADGTFDRLDLKQGTDSKWTATIIKILPRSNNVQKEEIADLQCKITTYAAGSQIRTVVCEIDARPVDGPLYQIVVEQTDDGKYDARKITKFVDRRNGQEVTKERIIGNGMARINPTTVAK